jgi:CRISPR system Cascade subunit CasE
VFLSKLSINVRSREFRRDYANVHDMHRTVMSAFTTLDTATAPRQEQGILWRLEDAHSGYAQYVQSRTQPDWSRLPSDYLTKPAEVTSLQPVLAAVTPGRKLAFRIVANPTYAKSMGPDTRGKRVAHRDPDKQIEWLVRRGEHHGFVIPVAGNGRPDVTPSPCPDIAGRKADLKGPITVLPVRYDGHLVVTDPDAFTDALRTGIGRAKAYGCGLLSLASPRTQRP